MEFTAQLQAYRQRAERGLNECLPAASVRPTRLHAAMRYSLEAGGKRLRPILVLATGELFGAKDDALLPAAVAIECVHTYSLIHDDLPCMDNDDLRRGRPTAHKQFDEATALLAGDALLTHAFGLLATHYAPAVGLALVRELAAAAGSQKLIGGQMEDLLAEKKTHPTAGELEFIHLNKTAAMIEVSLVSGGLIGLGHPDRDASTGHLATLRLVGRHLGLAFQIIDDILDATADSATLGKTAGKDAKTGKVTYVALHGLVASRKIAREHSDAALAALARLPGDNAFLAALVNTMAARTS
jgi:geranylgeranyl pyrophosphate synthase